MTGRQAPGFTHDSAGTEAATWTAELAARDLPALTLPADWSRLVVVAAHPDDETLGAGGLLARAGSRGLQVDVVVLTDGEASHPHSSTHSPERLAAIRREEVRAAVATLAPAAEVTWLGLPDGRLAEHEDEAVAGLVPVIGADPDGVLVCAPWRSDGHTDHEAAGRAAAVAAHRTDTLLVEYPIWVWHWGAVADLPWARARRLPLSTQELAAKGRAMAHHVSQVRPLSEQPGDEVLLGPGLLAHFERPEEVYLIVEAEPGPERDQALERVHRDRPDPWEVDSGWYERRKRAVTLAALPRAHYGSGLEVGCSVGALAADLAGRCDTLLAVDDSPTALARARTRLATDTGTELRRASVPDDWPEGRFDLVVMSEIGYFLGPTRLARTAALARDALLPEGHLLLCHWRHPVVGWPLTGDEVHRRVQETCAGVLQVEVAHCERDFVLHVLGRPR